MTQHIIGMIMMYVLHRATENIRDRLFDIVVKKTTKKIIERFKPINQLSTNKTNNEDDLNEFTKININEECINVEPIKFFTINYAEDMKTIENYYKDIDDTNNTNNTNNSNNK